MYRFKGTIHLKDTAELRKEIYILQRELDGTFDLERTEVGITLHVDAVTGSYHTYGDLEQLLRGSETQYTRGSNLRLQVHDNTETCWHLGDKQQADEAAREYAAEVVLDTVEDFDLGMLKAALEALERRCVIMSGDDPGQPAPEAGVATHTIPDAFQPAPDAEEAIETPVVDQKPQTDAEAARDNQVTKTAEDLLADEPAEVDRNPFNA